MPDNAKVIADKTKTKELQQENEELKERLSGAEMRLKSYASDSLKKE